MEGHEEGERSLYDVGVRRYTEGQILQAVNPVIQSQTEQSLQGPDLSALLFLS